MHAARNGSLERVVLTGFMGAGKSSVGRLLAPMLGWQFLDVDASLSTQAGLSIAQLFQQHGETGFRALEAEAVAVALQVKRSVIALGGGALEHAETRALLTADAAALLVYLEAPLHVSLARCAAEPGAAVRPLLENTEALEQRFLSRLPLYRAAHRTIPTGASTPQEIAELLADEIRRER